MSFFNRILGKPLEPDLLEAIDSNNYEKTCSLLKEGANVNFQGEKGNTPLIRSLNCKDTRIFNLLIDSGANIDLSTNNGYSPLLLSCARNDIEKVRFFVAKGSNIRQKTKEGWTALILASKNPSFFPENCQNGKDAELAQNLINVIHESTNYHAKNDPTDIVKILLKAGSDPNTSNSFGLTPLMAASEKVNYQTLECLLNNNASINLIDSDQNTALNYAVGTTVETYFKTLFDLSLVGLEQTMDESFSTPLIAVLKPKFESNREICVDTLIKYGANIHSIDGKGINILMNSANTGNVNVVKKLVDAGADIFYRNSIGMSPLFAAIVNGQNEVVNYLLSKGIDINIEMEGGETPLMTAVWGGHVDTVKLLIQKGANVKCKSITPANPTGEYPLEWAAIKYRDTHDPRYRVIGELLLNAGATLPQKYR